MGVTRELSERDEATIKLGLGSIIYALKPSRDPMPEGTIAELLAWIHARYDKGATV